MKNGILRFIHMSDLHFAHPTWSLSQFFSKRWLGNLNLIFSKERDFLTDRLLPLITLSKEKQVSHLVVSGDLTTTSLKREFSKAKEFLSEFTRAGIETFVLPGNHDQYTFGAYQEKRFYEFFPSEMKERGLSVSKWNEHWWFIALDTAIATSLVSSQGVFSIELEKKLEEALSQIPKEASIVLANHFPFFTHEPRRKRLIRAKELRELLERHPQIKLYLHGHTHRPTIADLRASNLPIVLDCGSTPHRTGSFHLIELSPQACKIEAFKWNQEWKPVQEHAFQW